MEVTETWSVDTSIGVAYVGLSVQAGVGWSNSASVKASQQVSMSIRPGKTVFIPLLFYNQNNRMILSLPSISGRINSQCQLQKDKREDAH